MVSLPVYDRNGSEVDTYEIDPVELAPRVNKQLLHDVVVMYQTNRRQGSASSKSRAEVAGSTQKMYRQKGTGNARAGSRRSNIRRGGGRAFAKRPRDWSYRLPKKAVRLATRMAMASRIADEEVTLIDDLKFEEPKTSEMASILVALAEAGEMVALTRRHPEEKGGRSKATRSSQEGGREGEGFGQEGLGKEAFREEGGREEAVRGPGVDSRGVEDPREQPSGGCGQP